MRRCTSDSELEHALACRWRKSPPSDTSGQGPFWPFPPAATRPDCASREVPRSGVRPGELSHRESVTATAVDPQPGTRRRYAGVTAEAGSPTAGFARPPRRRRRTTMPCARLLALAVALGSQVPPRRRRLAATPSSRSAPAEEKAQAEEAPEARRGAYAPYRPGGKGRLLRLYHHERQLRRYAPRDNYSFRAGGTRPALTGASCP
jgi:hypothetical protein